MKDSIIITLGLYLISLSYFEFLKRSYAITVNFLTSSYLIIDEYQEGLVNDFNAYSKKNHLNITLDRMCLSPQNASVKVENYATFVELKLKKKNMNYDLILIDNIHTNLFSNYVMDLNKYISKETLEHYSSGVAKRIGYIKDKLVSLPIYIDGEVFYSNRKLLDKYNEKPPETWDELIRIASKIKENESKEGNDNLVIFAPSFTETELTICTTINFFYSFRDTVESDMPSYTSNNCVRALEKIKEIKEKISSDEEYRYVDSELIESLLQGNILFTIYFYIPLDDQYYITPLPGERPGLSAACIGGQSIILNKHVSEERKIASGIIIDFFLSMEIQKKNAIKHKKWSALSKIYEDEEVCRNVDCELNKNLQYVPRPTHLLPNYNQYSFKFRNIIFDFIYKDAKASETLQRIEDITAISFISPSSMIGIVIITINVLLYLLIFSSLVIVTRKKNQFYLKTYDKFTWGLTLFCFCILIASNFSMVGSLTTFKCYLYQYFPIIGIIGLFYPILTFEIINFPEPNKFSEFVKKHHLKLNFGIITLDISYSALVYGLFPSKIKSVYVDDGKNYNECFIEKTNPQFILFMIMVASKAFMFPAIAILTFIEYNLLYIKNEIKTITILLYFNVLFIILFIISNTFHFQQFYFHCINKILSISIIVLVNYLCIVYVRMYYEKNKNNDNCNYGVKIVKRKHTSPLNNKEGRTSTTIRSKSLVSRIIDYHYSHVTLNDSKQDYSSNDTSQPSVPEINLYTGILTKSEFTEIQINESEQSDSSKEMEQTEKKMKMGNMKKMEQTEQTEQIEYTKQTDQ